MFATAEARRKGYDQVLWTDANEHKFVEEIGTMNVFFIIDGKAVTPDLSTGTILAGVTRDSVITLMKDMGVPIEEKRLNMDDVVSAYENGKLTEIFGTGTAATISLIRELKYKDKVMSFDESIWKVAPEVKRRMDAIKDGTAEDRHGWMFRI
jgi:branched-chain amino acid aminotransferase